LTLAIRAALVGLAAGLAACGSSNNHQDNVSHLRISGVTGQGNPVVGVPVTITDSTGAVTQSGATGVAPFVLTVPVTANLNPLTSFVTQRVLGATPSAAPTHSHSQFGSANVSTASIQQAVSAVDGVMQPLFDAMKVPSTIVADPIGSNAYQANSSNALDSLFDVAHFTAHSNTLSVGDNSGTPGMNAATYQPVRIPLTGAMPAALPSGPVASSRALSQGPTTTPIQHLVVIVGENQTFDGLLRSSSSVSR